jgi:hypothetical protein
LRWRLTAIFAGRVVIILMLAHTEMMRRLYDAKSGIHDVESIFEL